MKRTEVWSTRKSQLTKLSMKDKSIYYFIHNASRRGIRRTGRGYHSAWTIRYGIGICSPRLTWPTASLCGIWCWGTGSKRPAVSTQLWTPLRHIYLRTCSPTASDTRINEAKIVFPHIYESNHLRFGEVCWNGVVTLSSYQGFLTTSLPDWNGTHIPDWDALGTHQHSTRYLYSCWPT